MKSDLIKGYTKVNTGTVIYYKKKKNTIEYINETIKDKKNKILKNKFCKNKIKEYFKLSPIIDNTIDYKLIKKFNENNKIDFKEKIEYENLSENSEEYQSAYSFEEFYSLDSTHEDTVKICTKF